MLRIDDDGRVRVLTLDRPDALNAFTEDLYDATAEALLDSTADPAVAVVVLTGNGRAFSAGTDVAEMAERAADPENYHEGRYGFPGLVDQLAAFPKPLICAVNGLAIGIGATMLGYADLVVMSAEARIRCPFTDLGVAPEAASSYLLPQLLGRQHATWLLMSSEWMSADECARIGLAWDVVVPEDVLPTAMKAAQTLAQKPIASLVETKRTIVAGQRGLVTSARQREDAAYARLLGTAANLEALVAVRERRTPDFAAIDAAHPVDVERHRRD